MKKLIAFLSVLLPLLALAIETPNPTANIWPQSPKATQIREVSMPAPALLTGACEYSVPLYTISVEGVEIPLTLSYRSNGIKPDDDPYPIGYGWTLTPSLRVSRQIMGRPDEYFPFVGDRPHADFDEDYMLSYKCMNDKAHNESQVDTARMYDPEHDVFWVNLPGTSLTLMLDNGKFVGPSCEEYRITPVGSLDAIEVTDPRGVVYTFDIKGEAIDRPLMTTEWLLGSITLPSGRKIVFDWGEPIDHGRAPVTRFAGKDLKYSSAPWVFLVENDPLTDNTPTPHRYLNSHYLNSISFPGGTFNLSYEGSGLVATGFSVVSDSKAGSPGTVASGTFSHDGYLLRSVDIHGLGSYEFTYDPHRFEPSYEVDWWGYYTGRHSDYAHISPALELKQGDKGFFPEPYRIPGADRSVDTVMMRANMLTAVSVPTGGRIEWEYEPHRFESTTCTDEWITGRTDEITLSCGGGLRVRAVKLFTGEDDSSPRIRRYVYGPQGNGMAVVEALPFLHTFVSECDLLVNRPRLGASGHGTLTVDRHLSLNIGSDYMSGRTGEQPLWYSHVAEIEEEGKTEYEFTRLTRPNVVHRRWGYVAPVENYTTFSKGPQLTSTKVYAKTGNAYTLLEETSNTYSMELARKGTLKSVFIRRKLMQYDNSQTAPDCAELDIMDMPASMWTIEGEGGADEIRLTRDHYRWFEAFDYQTLLQTEKLVFTEHKDYRENGSIATRTTNTYVPGTSLISKTEVFNSAGTTTTEFLYAGAQTPSVGNAMKAANVIGIPTRVTETFGSAKVGYRLEMQQCAVSCFRPAKVWNIAGNETWSTADFQYDQFGNLTKATGADGCTTVTEWSEGLYPVKSTLGGKLVSTAEWRPLVGVTKLTAPAAPTLHFAYDQCGRLVLATENGITTESHSYSITPDGLSYVSSRAYAVTEGVVSTETTTCYDGLGRPWCAHTASGDVSVATLTEYDGMGRPWRQWAGVPMASAPSSAASFRSAATSFYNTSAAFSQTSYESSPRRLTTAVTRPGDGWDTHPATVRRLTNSSPWPRFVPTETGVSKSGTYPAGSLSVEVASDEDGVTVTKYADMRGLTIAEDRGGLVIHYVYDDYGRLRYALPPGMNLNSSSISRSSAEMQGIAYWYDYDSRGRCTSKKLPGVDPVTYYYDPADRLVVEFNPAFVSDCRVYGYDFAGRMVVTAEGDMSAAQARAFASECRTATFGGGALAGYSISGLPSGFEAVTASYYDNYSFISSLSLPASFSKGGNFTLAGNVYGLLTGAYTGAGYEAYHYDSRMRMKVRVATGFNEGRTEFEYNNGGAVTSEKWMHPDGSVLADRSLTRETSYDSGGRISGHTVTQACNPLNDVPVIQPLSITLHDKDVASLTMEYDALGRLSATNLNGTQANRITTSYNIHGWPTSRKYSSSGKVVKAESYAYTPFYNGNISSKLTVGGQSDYRYAYSYDSNNRLTEAAFSYIRPGSIVKYSTSYEYDDRGNTLYIIRDGISLEVPGRAGTIGNAYLPQKVVYDFTFDGNQSKTVTITPQKIAAESSMNFTNTVYGSLSYDKAGRLVQDSSRKISHIKYDSNSHPVKITFSNGDTQQEEWDEMGNHLSTTNTIYSTSGFTRPIGSSLTAPTVVSRKYYGSGQIVENDSLVMTRFSGGFFDGDGKVKFYLNDYQGNNIAVIDANGEMVEEMGYYPYGMPWSVPESTPYLFADKEYQHLSSLDEYIHGARRNVPYACAFSTTDPLCEDRKWESPYLFCSGNPIRNIDPTGEEPSPYEAALMSYLVYRERDKSKKEGEKDEYAQRMEDLNNTNWYISSLQTNIQMNHPAWTGIGMQSMLFERKTENGMEYAYVFAGTNSWEDGVEDVTQLFGISAQLPKALENANELIDEIGNSELTFVGHSAGGFLATGCGMDTGKKAITFNTAVISKPTRLAYGLQETGIIDNYISSTPDFFGNQYPVDVVTVAQAALFLKAPGNHIPVTTGWGPTHKILEIVRALERK